MRANVYVGHTDHVVPPANGGGLCRRIRRAGRRHLWRMHYIPRARGGWMRPPSGASMNYQAQTVIT